MWQSDESNATTTSLLSGVNVLFDVRGQKLEGKGSYQHMNHSMLR